MDLTFGARGSKGSSVEVNVSFDGNVGGKAWVFTGRAEQDESEDFLGDEPVPFLGGEVGFARGKSSAKIIFECADRTFGGVAAVGIWGDKLEVDVALAEGFMHGTRALVVEDVESGGSTMLLDVFIARLPGFSDLQGLSVLEKLGVDGVGVVLVEDKDILVSA